MQTDEKLKAYSINKYRVMSDQDEFRYPLADKIVENVQAHAHDRHFQTPTKY